MQPQQSILLAMCALTIAPAVQAAPQPEAEASKPHAPVRRRPLTADEELSLAIRAGEVDKARAAIARRADVWKQSFWRTSAVCYAGHSYLWMSPQQAVCTFVRDGTGLSSKKTIELLRLLFDNGVRPSAQLARGAAINGDAPLLRLFLEYKANPNARQGSRTLLQDVRQELDRVTQRVQSVGEEEAAREQPLPMQGWVAPSYNTQKQNLQNVIEILLAAGARDEAG